MQVRCPYCDGKVEVNNDCECDKCSKRFKLNIKKWGLYPKQKE